MKKLKITLVIEIPCNEIELTIKTTPSQMHHNNQPTEETNSGHLNTPATDYNITNGIEEEILADQTSEKDIVVVDELPVRR